MPRVKTYSSQNGFVYQYQFTGSQSAPQGEMFRFHSTHDRKTAFDLTILLPHEALLSWEVTERRTLNPTERYAIAKMALFAAFDEAESPGTFPNPVPLSDEKLREIVTLLDL